MASCSDRGGFVRSATEASEGVRGRLALARWAWLAFALVVVAPAVVFFGTAARAAETPYAPSKAVGGLIGIGQPRSAGYTGASGAAVEALPLEIAPGRKHFQPQLSLTYNSGFGRAGVSGVGWSLDVGSIQRSPSRGIPAASNVDEFVLGLAGSAEILVPVGAGAYRPRYETTFRQTQFFGDHWEVRDAQGVLYVFGSSPATRIDGLLWELDRIQDPNGNTVTISYLVDGNTFYPQEIRYTGNATAGDPGANTVEFEYADRADVTISYALGVAQRHGKILHRVSNFAGTQLVRRYELSHHPSSASGRSLLDGVDLVAADDTSRIHTRQLGYQGGPYALGGTTATGAFPVPFYDKDGNDTGARTADVDGDGVIDVLDNGSHVWRGDGHGGFAASAPWSSALAAAGVTFADGNGLDTGTRLVDVNGDFRPDIVVSSHASGVRRVLLNTGSGWEESSALSQAYAASLAITAVGQTQVGFVDPGCQSDAGVVSDASVTLADGGVIDCSGPAAQPESLFLAGDNGSATGASFADVNGDGLPDIVWSYQTTQALFDFHAPDSGPFAGQGISFVPVVIRAVYLNTGAGWAANDALTASLKGLPPFVVDTTPSGYDLLDVNGDGAADVVATETPSSSSDGRGVWLATGSGWVASPEFTSSLRATSIASLDGTNSLGLVPVDYDHDGLLDYLRADSTVQVAYRNTGTGWAEDAAMEAIVRGQGITFVDSGGKPSGWQLLDADGDGVVDVILDRDQVGNSIQRGAGPVPDLLTMITTALGEKTTFTYGASTAFDNRGSDGLQHLPSVLPVVVGMSRSDGRGNVFPSTVTYAGGLFDQARGEAATFRSFASASTIDSRGILTVRTFAQSEALAGAATDNRTFDTSNALRRETSAVYATSDAGHGVTQIVLAQTDDQTVDPAGVLHTRVRYAYDAFLNPTEIDKDGDVAVTGDEGRTVIRYAQNPAAGIVSTVSATLVYDASGALHSQGIVLYDGASAEGSVQKGNPTGFVDSIQIGGATVKKTVAYDGYGNPTQVTDRNGGVTSFGYDATHTFQTSAVDPSGRTIQTTYDPRFGSSVADVDANGNTTTRAYDAFGRLVRETLPGDECSPRGTRSLTYSAVGDPTSQFIEVSLTQTPGQAQTIDTFTYLDGFAQAYRNAVTGPAGRPVVVLTTFDDAGNPTTQTEPFFDGDAFASQVTTYDALRRVVQRKDARAGVVRTTYRGAARDVVDARGNATTYVADAYGNTLEEDQLVGAKTLVTKRSYDVLGALVGIVDPAGQTTSITYDALGRKTRIVDPAMGTFSYEYDGNGNVVAQTGSAGRMTMTYGPSNDLLQKSLPGGQTITYAYGTASVNGVGRPVQVQDAAGTLALRYDPRGNVVERRRTYDGITYVTGYSWDSMGRIRRIAYPDGFSVRYTYNAAGLVDSVADGQGTPIVSGISYNALGRVTKLPFANGVTSQYTFDAAGLVSTIDTVNASGTALQGLTYAYDPTWNVTGITDRVTAANSQAFQYDAVNRLVDATGGYGHEVYEYDEIGNFVRKGNLVFGRDAVKKSQVTCAVDLSLASRNSNGLKGDSGLYQCASALAATGSPLTPDERTTLQGILANAKNGGDVAQSELLVYDGSGNVVQKGSQVLSYDAEGRLLSVMPHSPKSASEVNVYDMDGRRFYRQAGPGENDETAYVDGIYERDEHGGAGTARRHVKLGSFVIATSIVSAHQYPLITSAPPDALSQCKAGGPVTSAVLPVLPGAGADLRRSLGDDRGADALVAARERFLARTTAAVVLSMVLGALFAMRRRLRTVVVRRRLRAAASGALRAAVGSAALVRRAPAFSAISMLLVVVQLVTAVGCSRPNGAPGEVTGRVTSAAQAEQRYYYHLDHLGNTNVISDAQGNVFERREYTPFGTQFVASGASDLDLSLDGHTFDTTVGLYYFGARHYDPLIGRFTSADTQIPSASPQALHRYAFNANNPIRYVDFTGHDFWDWVANTVVPVLVGVALVVAGVVLVVATGGTAAPLLAIAVGGALVGAGAAILIARATSSNLSFGDYVAVALTGAIVGATIAVGAAVIAGAPAAATLPGWYNAGGALGAAFGSVSSTVLGVANGDSPWALFGTVVLGTFLGWASGQAVGAKEAQDISIDTLDPTPVLKVFGLDLGKAAPLVLASYSGAVNGYFTTASLTGQDTNVPNWVGTLFTASGFIIPGAAATYAGVSGAPAAANVAPVTH